MRRSPQQTAHDGPIRPAVAVAVLRRGHGESRHRSSSNASIIIACSGYRDDGATEARRSARTGEPRWDTPVAGGQEGCTFSNGPIVVDGTVVAGLTGCWRYRDDTMAVRIGANMRKRAHDNRLTVKRGDDPSGRASTVPTFADLSAPGRPRGQWRGRTRETRALGHVDMNAAGEVIRRGIAEDLEAPRASAGVAVRGRSRGAGGVRAGPVVKAAISFTALTAVRSGEARGATWGEVDLELREWHVPAARMKAGGNIGYRCRTRLWWCWRA